MNNVTVIGARNQHQQSGADQYKSKRKFDVDEAFADLGIKPFKDEFRRLSKLAGAEDFSSSKTAYALLRSQLAMLINTLPVVEAAMHEYKSDRSAYAMVAVSNHLREVAHDLRAFGDQTELAEHVRKDVVQLILQSLATSVVSSLIKKRTEMRNKLPPKVGRYVDEQLRLYQESMSDAFAEAESTSAEMLIKALSAR